MQLTFGESLPKKLKICIAFIDIMCYNNKEGKNYEYLRVEYSKVKASEYKFYLYVKEDIIMANKYNHNDLFFMGSWAGCIGHTENGYPIYDHFIVEMVTKSGKERFFQFHELYGLYVDGKWREAQYGTERCVSSDDTVYERPVWKFEGIQIPEEELVKRYDIVEITDFVKATERYALNTCYSKSPYVDLDSVLGGLSNERLKLDGRVPRYRAIVKAMRDYLEMMREDARILRK